MDIRSHDKFLSSTTGILRNRTQIRYAQTTLGHPSSLIKPFQLGQFTFVTAASQSESPVPRKPIAVPPVPS
jgi:hypothetical protein